jgi:hypothetical protein
MIFYLLDPQLRNVFLSKNISSIRVYGVVANATLAKE